MWKKLCALALTGALLAPCCGALEGMDISVYQGDADLAAAKAEGIQAVYIRSSFGIDGVDDRFAENAQKAAQAGLDFGFYHYMEAAGPAEARLEARHFAQVITGAGYTCRPVLDFEVDAQLSAAGASAVVRAFLEELEGAVGQTPMLYADVSNARRMEPDLGRYPLWVAEYDAGAPQLYGTPWTEYAGWQYTSQGRIDGIQGDVDRDVFTSRVLLAGKGETAPGKPEDDPAAGGSFFTITIRRGDTLYALARRYGTTVDALVRLNGIADPDLIYAGDTLRVPGQGGGLYTVRPGDTLSAIAWRYGTTVARLAAVNRIVDPDLIYPGQLLRV